MAYNYSELVAKAQAWAGQAQAEGWIDQAAAAELAALDTRVPEQLFAHAPSRPLVVAFMGGSGVGKSTLLNRLAGKAVARTGVERPTSREVTLFHHHSLTVEQLPGALPTQQAQVAHHDDDGKQNLLWIDMPDFDSVELGNRQLVLQWLPHIDVLVYVVSPERYRDEKAWQLLLAEGGRHAWLFVMNQWDKGLPEQFDDFRQQLHKAGFFEPVMFKTACGDNLQADEFPSLESTINALANAHVIEQLTQRNQQRRKQELGQKLQRLRASLGDDDGYLALESQWPGQWRQTSQLLRQGFAWPMQALAKHYANHAVDLLTAGASKPGLWDAWAQERFDDALDELAISASQLALPVPPLKHQLRGLGAKAEKTLQNQVELSVRQALAHPGNLWQRGFLKMVRCCEISLPLAAMGWAGYQAFIGYYHGGQANGHYLGVDFAVHSLLLVALTWLLPFFILQKAQPSLQKTARRGLEQGLDKGLASLDLAVTEALAAFKAGHDLHSRQVDELAACCRAPAEPPPRASADGHAALSRMVLD